MGRLIPKDLIGYVKKAPSTPLMPESKIWSAYSYLMTVYTGSDIVSKKPLTKIMFDK